MPTTTALDPVATATPSVAPTTRQIDPSRSGAELAVRADGASIDMGAHHEPQPALGAGVPAPRATPTTNEVTTMTTTAFPLHEPATTSPDHDLEGRRANAVRAVSSALTTIRSGATTLAGRAPGAAHATQVRASEATTALQRLPDSTLRWLAAGSLGVAAGFQLAGAPRLLRAAGAAPALLMGAAIALRPTQRRTEGVAPEDGQVQEVLADPQDALKGYRGEDYDGA